MATSIALNVNLAVVNKVVFVFVCVGRVACSSRLMYASLWKISFRPNTFSSRNVIFHTACMCSVVGEILNRTSTCNCFLYAGASECTPTKRGSEVGLRACVTRLAGQDCQL